MLNKFQTARRVRVRDDGRMTKIRTLTPRLVVRDAARAIDFYATAFGAKELERYTDANGKIVHAAVDIDGHTVTVKDEGDGDPAPPTIGGTPVLLSLNVDNADVVAEAMLNAGATVIYPIQDWDYGRGGRLADPFGHLWMITQPLPPQHS
jgi:PhnB protein